MLTKVEVAVTDGHNNPVADLDLPNDESIAHVIGTASATPQAAPVSPKPEEKKPAHWGAFAQTATQPQIKERLAGEISEILIRYKLEKNCCLGLLEPMDSIDSFDLDKIFGALTETNPAHDKDVLLFLLSRGGEAEPAYQISKICKSFARDKFKAIVPRHAKSAATLIAIGADEIHMGPLGQLGPIDPQIGGLPALGVSQALKTIASVSEMYPRSAEMFARYLQKALTVEQIGYCDRISESTVQYAERLLSTKPKVAARAPAIAKELVHEYKDHGFVIDLAEAKAHLGEEWVITGTPELQAAEAIYSLIEMVNFIIGFTQSKRILVSGALGSGSSIVIFDTKRG